MSSSQSEIQNFGPETMLRTLEELGLGEGPLARALRKYLKSPTPGSIAIGSTYRGPEDAQCDKHRRDLDRDLLSGELVDDEDSASQSGGGK